MDNFNLRKYLTEHKLTRASIELNEVSLDTLKTQFVDTGRIKDSTFQSIIDATQKVYLNTKPTFLFLKEIKTNIHLRILT